MKKFALFVFNGDPMCFIHVLLNALDMKERGHRPAIVLEGTSVTLLPELVKDGSPLKGLWQRAVEKGLVEGVCKACSGKLGTLEEAEKQGIPLLSGMSGHPPMAEYIENSFEIITF